MNCSTSCGARDGEIVITWTWLFVISGTASIGNLIKLYTPQAMRPRVKIPINNLFLTENVMT
jgi:hypothetical protein